MKKVSVIVPVFNMAADDKLKWCLDSLVHQTLSDEDIEIIAVDDCSTDNSYEIMKDYQAKYPGRFIALHSPVNHHQGGAKNIGLTIACGEWIGFIDADDWVTEDYYEILLKKALSTGADMVGCDYCLVNSHTMEIGKIVHNNNEAQTGIMDKEKYKRLLLDTGSLVVKLYKRCIIFGENSKGPIDYHYLTMEQIHDSRIHIFPEDIFYEDNAVSNTWMLRCRHFEYIPEPLYYYYQHDASTVHTISIKNLEDRKAAGRMIVEQAKEYGYLDEYKEELEFAYTVLFYVNTLFSAMPLEQHIKGCYSFCRELGEEMKRTFPDFQNNKYYIERVHPEEKKLIAMQMQSHAKFYGYYRMLWAYRNIRKANKRKRIFK
ncbi:MAG: glycosyltransferase [Butyrivibrio sp.]|nr:glycosyltransferase [Butyrivibrio sp.]